MESNLLLVDFENRQKIDLSSIHPSFRVYFFIGHHQKLPKICTEPSKANRFRRIDYLKIDGDGKNALDFHIAFELGRVYETERLTTCFILSGDKGFNPLVSYLNRLGLKCTRIESIDQLVPTKVTEKTFADQGNSTICRTCLKASTIEHNGGRWCTNCGSFAVTPLNKVPVNRQNELRLDHFTKNSPIIPSTGPTNACLHCGIGINDDSLLCDACDD